MRENLFYPASVFTYAVSAQSPRRRSVEDDTAALWDRGVYIAFVTPSNNVYLQYKGNHLKYHLLYIIIYVVMYIYIFINIYMK